MATIFDFIYDNMYLSAILFIIWSIAMYLLGRAVAYNKAAKLLDNANSV